MRSVPSVVACGLVCLSLIAGCGGGNSGGSGQSAPLYPVANVSGPYQGMVGAPVSFNAGGSSDPQGQTLTYAWTFGDGSTGTGLTTTHTYGAPGTYTVTVTVKNTSGLTGFASSYATIAASLPLANPGGPYSGTVGTAVSFGGGGSSDPQGQTLTYAWNFGDGSTGTGVSPSHTYTSPGTYTVTLTVMDSGGLMGTATTKATIVVAPVAALTGIVSGGTAPIVGAHVYLLAANTIGYGQASLSLLSAALTGSSDPVGAYVTTGSNGGFSLTGEYNCASGQQLYLYALGGNSGSGANAAAGLMAAIGACPSNTAPAVFAAVNEVSTVAAAYAMAGFATDATHVSSSGTALAQVGVANAFANAGNLATLGTGVALATTPAGNGVVPQAEINTLANVLAACVNSASSCNSLLSTATSDGTPTGTKPTDTATAAINISHHPGVNVAVLYGLPTSAVFSPQLTAQPNDLTVVLNFSGGGLNYPEGIAVDRAGDVWVANFVSGAASSVTELASSGAFLSGSAGYMNAGMIEPDGVALDGSGDAWVANWGGSSFASEIASSGSFLTAPHGYTSTGSNSSVAVDGSGDAWFAGGGPQLWEYSSSGAAVSSNPYTGGGLTAVQGIAIDGSGSAWATSSAGYAVRFSRTGTVLSGSSGYAAGGCCATAFGVAIDGTGNAWITDKKDGTVFELSNSGTLLSAAGGYPDGGVSSPQGVAMDGAGEIWIAGFNGISELSNTGGILSGANGYRPTNLYGPFGIAVDGSGNVWVSNNDGPGLTGSVLEFVGAGTPVITPIAAGLPATPTANGSSNLGTRP